MSRKKSRTLTDGELEFMSVLWENGDCAPEDVMEALRHKGRIVTGGTVRNILLTLLEKGYITRTKRGKAYYYRAKVDENNAKKSLVVDLLEKAFRGSESHLIASLLGNRNIQKDEMEKIKHLIEKHEAGDTDVLS